MARDEKKRKHSEVNGDDVDASKKAKKEKKDKKKRSSSVGAADAATAVLNAVEQVRPGSVVVDEDGDVEINLNPDATETSTLIVPFANPLANDKLLKKVLKSTKKAAKAKTLKRGVKECVKAMNKSPSQRPSTAVAVAIFAADIWPIDVISHLPVLCEDHHIPYVYVNSRAELGRASGTKRPTSVVMIGKDKGKNATDSEDWDETYSDLLKAVEKAAKTVKV